jgi:hypothetical protein
MEIKMKINKRTFLIPQSNLELDSYYVQNIEVENNYTYLACGVASWKINTIHN